MTYSDDFNDRPTTTGAPMPDPAKVLDAAPGRAATDATDAAANAATNAAADADRAAGQADKRTRTFTEEFRLSGEAVVAKVKELVREGNVRRIAIKNDDGKVLIEIPLTIGVIGTVLLPVWAAVGAIAAMVANLTITVERSA